MRSPYLNDGDVIVYLGDCAEVMREMEPESVDAIVCDPPYGLEFMGKEWDSFAPADRKNASVWNGRRQGQAGWEKSASERSGKGGGGPSYTSQHKGAKRCAKCGKRAFSGSPCNCDAPEWVIEHRQEAPTTMLAFAAWCETWAREAYRVLKPGGHLLAFGGTRTYHRLTCGIEDAGFEIRDSIAWNGAPLPTVLQWVYGSGFPKSLDVSKAIDKAAGAEREVVGTTRTNVGMQGGNFANGGAMGEVAITAPATDAARKWQGWGTALKPAWEPCVVARKPLAGTVAENVQAHGTGALNIDGCRIATSDVFGGGAKGTSGFAAGYGAGDGWQPGSDKGRWPANVALDEQAAAMLDAQSGDRRPATSRTERGDRSPFSNGTAATEPSAVYADNGGASRFYYTAKASRADRNTSGANNTHPTVKPTDLMRWLVRLVTPPGGVVLDPFAGSGSTLVAARAEGFRSIGIEREDEYAAIIAERLAQLSLLSEIDE